MKDFTLAELGAFVGLVGGVVTSILLTLFKSKCETIKCCCWECKRNPKLKTTESVATSPRP